jgi:hypothetical protein
MEPLTADESPCGGCQSLDSPGNDKTVTLLTGHVVCGYCPSWRLECMDRHNRSFDVLALPDKEARREYLARHGKAHGELSRQRLEAEVIAMHRRRLAAAATEF